MIRRAFLLSLAVVALVAGPVAAQQEYDGTDAEASVLANGDIVVTGEGFEPNAPVTWQVDFTAFDDENAAPAFAGHEGEFAIALASVSAPREIVQTGTTQADANGNVEFVVEDQGEGRYVISMTDGVNEATVVVTKGEAGAGTTGTAGQSGSLPTTGTDSSLPLTQAGIVLLMVGGVAVYVARRRRANAFG